MIRTLIEHYHNNSSREVLQETHREIQEDGDYLPRGVSLDFTHFDGNNPTRWVFKVSQYFDFHQTPPIKEALMAAYHIEGEALI